ncbi:ComEC/Rec2 family competence protein [Paracoccus sp. (in: a-proteobacteria)]|uniref:ComEC/Rec2 family competence protein n=1 Tax=Paracoccus sp. TaxID=267 RepID=UPI0035B43F86
MPWVPVWMGLGIGAWFALPDEPGQGFYLATALAGVACLLAWQLALRAAMAGRLGWDWGDRLRLVFLAAFLVIAGAGLSGLRSHMVAGPVLDFRYYGPVEGRLIGIDRSSRDRMRVTLDQVRLHDVAPWKQPERVRISLLAGDVTAEPGERVMLTAHLGPPAGPAEPGGFDFRRMAWFESLGAVGYTRTPIMTVDPPVPGGGYALHRLRMSLAEAIRVQIGGQAGAVAAALMTGDRSGIHEATNDIMRASNLYHIISISGLHMSMLAGFAYAALRLIGVGVQGAGMGRHWPLHKLAAFGALVAAAIYLWLSGGGVATERAFIMVAVMLLAIIADRRAISLRTVAVAAVMILAVTPEALTSPGFQMSFAATVALILAQGPWLRISPHLPWWLRPLAMLFLSSLVASIATSPIAAAHFGRITQYGLLANLLVVPVVGLLVMPGGVIAAFLATLGLAAPALWVMGLGVKWMLFVAEWISGLNGATELVPAAPAAVLPLMGLGAVLMLLAPLASESRLRGLIMLRRGAGLAMLILAMIIWRISERPLMLISAQGDAVAILTDAGRVPSKPKGGAFAVSNWLEADGDAATQAEASLRPLWAGASNARNAALATGQRPLRVHHLTGARAQDRVKEVCRDGALLVMDSRMNIDIGAAAQRSPDCGMIDLAVLQQSGAIALYRQGPGIRLVATDHARQGRAWTAPGLADPQSAARIDTWGH